MSSIQWDPGRWALAALASLVAAWVLHLAVRMLLGVARADAAPGEDASASAFESASSLHDQFAHLEVRFAHWRRWFFALAFGATGVGLMVLPLVLVGGRTARMPLAYPIFIGFGAVVAWTAWRAWRRGELPLGQRWAVIAGLLAMFCAALALNGPLPLSFLGVLVIVCYLALPAGHALAAATAFLVLAGTQLWHPGADVAVVSRQIASAWFMLIFAEFLQAGHASTLASFKAAALRLDRLRRRLQEDIAAMRAADEARRESETNLERLVTESPLPMAITGPLPEGRVDMLNRRFTAVFGYTASDFPDEESWWLRAYPDRAYRDRIRGSWTEAVSAMLAAGRSSLEEPFTAEITGKDGRRLQVEVHLTVTATRSLIVFEDVTEQRRLEERLKQLASFDELTRLPNRRLFRDRLDQEMRLSRRTGRFLVLILIDLDGFKSINDTFGHDVGDLYLAEAAARIVRCVRQHDTVARLGGDEFTVIAGALAEPIDVDRIVSSVLASLSVPFELRGNVLQMSASMGVATFPDRAAEGRGGDVRLALQVKGDELLKRADLAMYQAKAAGRNTFRLFDPAMQQALERRTAMERELRDAIAREALELYFQPQFDRDDAVMGAEVLLRWRHPRLGNVPPSEFIPLAEDTGLIVPLGLWVLETSCRLLAAWAGDPAASGLRLAVNLSPRQFRQADFVDDFRQVLARTGADPHSLTLEITESLLIENLNEARPKLEAIAATGVEIALDDFGTGTSSLAYLTRLPLAQLKIDRSFVAHMEDNAADAAVCAAIISLARNLELSVVAEGVETEAQRHVLRSVHACDYLQGYLLGRPMPLGDFQDFIAARAAVAAG